MFGWLNRNKEMKLVRELMAAGKWDSAVLKLDELARRYPRNTDIALHRGFGLQQLQRYAEALPELQRVQRTFDEDSGLWELLGDTLFNLQRYAEAIKPLDRTLKLSPDRLTARYLRASCLQAVGRHREALADCQNYLAGSPYDKRAYLLKALIHEGMCEPEEGLAAARIGLILDPVDADLLAIRARLLCRAGRPEAALEAIDAATAVGRGSSEMESRRIELLMLMGRHDEALPLLNQAIETHPNRKNYLARATAYAGMGRHENASQDRSSAAQITQSLLEQLKSSGVPRNAAVIEASLPLFAAGVDDGCALVLLTFDDALNANTVTLERFAKSVAELKQKSVSSNSAMRAPASAISSHGPVITRRIPVPLELTEQIPCYAVDLNIYREFLPERRLSQERQILSVIAEPGDTGRTELAPIVPFAAEGNGVSYFQTLISK